MRQEDVHKYTWLDIQWTSQLPSRERETERREREREQLTGSQKSGFVYQQNIVSDSFLIWEATFRMHSRHGVFQSLPRNGIGGAVLHNQEPSPVLPSLEGFPQPLQNEHFPQTLIGRHSAGPDGHPMSLNAGIFSTSTDGSASAAWGWGRLDTFVCGDLTAQE